MIVCHVVYVYIYIYIYDRVGCAELGRACSQSIVVGCQLHLVPHAWLTHCVARSAGRGSMQSHKVAGNETEISRSHFPPLCKTTEGRRPEDGLLSEEHIVRDAVQLLGGITCLTTCLTQVFFKRGE